MKNKEHLTVEGLEKIKQIKSKMNSSRLIVGDDEENDV